ncbi:MAG: VOC family protein [Candidatus Promineifilaceae bacterium]
MASLADSSSPVLGTVIIQSSQIEALASFYGSGFALGSPEITGDDHLGFTLSNLYFGFDQVETAPAPTESISIWFEVHDIQAVFERFVGLGAKVKYPPTEKPWGVCLAALYDLDENLFGLSQPQ